MHASGALLLSLQGIFLGMVDAPLVVNSGNGVGSLALFRVCTLAKLVKVIAAPMLA